MIYRIVTYDRTTDRMKGNLPIPSSVLEQIKRIAGFGPKDDGLGEYPLDKVQTRQVAGILDFNPNQIVFYYYVESYDPPEDGTAYNRSPKPQSDIIIRSKCRLAAAYKASGKRMMNPSRFGILTLGNVSAFIVSLSPMSLFSARI